MKYVYFVIFVFFAGWIGKSIEEWLDGMEDRIARKAAYYVRNPPHDDF